VEYGRIARKTCDHHHDYWYYDGSVTGNAVSQWIGDLGIWPLVVMVVPSIMLFRKRGREAIRKQKATLYHAIIVFLVCAAATVIVSRELSDLYLAGAVVVIAVGAVVLRKHVFPYRLRCPECGRRHDLFSREIRNVYVMDDNLCDACRERLAKPE
jgi:hypothetical protein